jgi:hypothetical protein
MSFGRASPSSTGGSIVSSTGRGTDREANDNYPTPSWCVRRLLDKIGMELPDGVWGEPCVGAGAIVRAVDAHDSRRRNDEPTQTWITQDVRHEVTPNFLGNFATAPDETFARCQVLITNPPFSIAREIIHSARRIAPQATIIMLLRLNFFGSEGRYGWLSKDTPDIYQLPNRPSFVRGKTDSVEYGWFVWSPTARSWGTIRMLGLTSLEERKRG